MDPIVIEKDFVVKTLLTIADQGALSGGQLATLMGFAENERPHLYSVLDVLAQRGTVRCRPYEALKQLINEGVITQEESESGTWKIYDLP